MSDPSATDTLAQMKQVLAEEMALTRKGMAIDLEKIAAYEKQLAAAQVLIAKQEQAERDGRVLHNSIEELASAVWTLLADLEQYRGMRNDLQDLAQAILAVQMASHADKQTIARWSERVTQIAEGGAKRADHHYSRTESTHIDGDNVVTGGNQTFKGSIKQNE